MHSVLRVQVSDNEDAFFSHFPRYCVFKLNADYHLKYSKNRFNIFIVVSPIGFFGTSICMLSTIELRSILWIYFCVNAGIFVSPSGFQTDRIRRNSL